MTDARIEKNLKSIRMLEKLLHEIIASPQKYADELVIKSALTSQGALAKLEAPLYGITGSSLNTLKRISDEYLNCKFAGIEVLRKDSIKAISDVNKSSAINGKSAPPKNFEEKYRETSHLLQVAKQDLWLVTMALNKALRRMKFYADQTGDPKISRNCLREQAEIRDMFNLRSKHNGEANYEEGS